MEKVSYASGLDGEEISSYLNVPPKALGAVVILRGVAGPDLGYTDIAAQLGQAGYAALVHSWQQRGDDPPDDMLLADIESAIAFLKARIDCADRMAVFGYCKGGGYAVLAASRCPDIKMVAAFHGFSKRVGGATLTNRNPIDAAAELSQSVILLHGESDSRSPVAQMRELAATLLEHGVRASIQTYPGVEHGFAVSTHKGYDPAAAADAFERALGLLRKTLP